MTIYYGFYLLPYLELTTAVIELQTLLAQHYGLLATGGFIPHISLKSLFIAEVDEQRVCSAISKVMDGYSPIQVYLIGIQSFGRQVIFIDANQLPDESINLPLRRLHTRIKQAIEPIISAECLFSPREQTGDDFHAHITIAHRGISPTSFDQIFSFCRDFEPIRGDSFAARQFRLIAFTSEDWSGSWWETLEWDLVREWTFDQISISDEMKETSNDDAYQQARAPVPFSEWFDDPSRIDQSAIYLERFMNYGLTPGELRAGKPIIAIAQTGSDLSPCNRIHLELARRVREGIRDAGGIAMEFPVHPIAENCRRPTAALDRNLAYLGLVEVLYGYPIDAVVLTTGCHKTTPAAIMAAATVDIPAIILSGGPMLDGWSEGELIGSGTISWKSRRCQAAGLIDEEEFFDAAMASAPSVGHCNTMGTASTMNAVAEVLGMSLPGCAAIPAPYRERAQMAYATGKRIVKLAFEDLRPSQILTRDAFLNAIIAIAAVGGSTNAQPHLMAMARHAGAEITPHDWAQGYDIPLLGNMQPADKYLGERFHRAGGVPAVLWELLHAGKVNGDVLTVTGRTLADNIVGRASTDPEIIASYDAPLKPQAGFLVLSGNLFDFAIMKTSVISDEFRLRYLCEPGREGVFEGRAIVFDGAEDYHARINDASLNIDEHCILVMRGAGPIGWPGAAEVVNMQPPDALLQKGIGSLPSIGDGRQSGTSDSPSILNASPESAVGGGLAWLRTRDMIRIDLNAGRCDALVPEDEIERRKKQCIPAILESATPWQESYRATVGQLDSGAVLEAALKYRGVASKTPRHNH